MHGEQLAWWWYRVLGDAAATNGDGLQTGSAGHSMHGVTGLKQLGAFSEAGVRRFQRDRSAQRNLVLRARGLEAISAGLGRSNGPTSE